MNVVVLFTDIRGFTRWSEGIEAFHYIDDFITTFYKILSAHFSDTCLKKLGDGAMMITIIEKEVTKDLEMHIDVDVSESIHTFYEISEPNEPLIPGIKFLCIYRSGNPESKNHSEIKWVSEEELALISPEEFIPGTKNDFMDFIARYKNEVQTLRTV